jgi:hypothetical protein
MTGITDKGHYNSDIVSKIVMCIQKGLRYKLQLHENLKHVHNT